MKTIYIYPRRWWWLRQIVGASWIHDVAIAEDGRSYMVKDGMVVIDDLPFEIPVAKVMVDNWFDMNTLLFNQMDKETFLSTVFLDGRHVSVESCLLYVERFYGSN